MTYSNDLMRQRFDQFIQVGNFTEAAKIAANSQDNSLRSIETIEKLRRISNTKGGDSLLFQYFESILETSKLSKDESIEFCKISLAQNKTSLIEKLVKEDKFTSTEELGDLFKEQKRIALAIYLRANVAPKIFFFFFFFFFFAEFEMFDKLKAYCQKFSYQPNWLQVVTDIASLSPDKILPTLTYIANDGNPFVDPKKIDQVQLQFNLPKAAISFLIDVLPQNREEDSELQTFLFEIVLNYAPKLSEELFSRNTFSYYDHQRVATFCERRGNFQRALENYTDLSSIKRCIVNNTESISQEYLIQYFDHMSPEFSIECLREDLNSKDPALFYRNAANCCNCIDYQEKVASIENPNELMYLGFKTEYLMHYLLTFCAIFEISLGMEAVHAAGLIHKNLKPKNILFDEKGHVKVSYCTLSSILGSKMKILKSNSESSKFMGPELLNEN